jgi:hypothetical protein
LDLRGFGCAEQCGRFDVPSVATRFSVMFWLALVALIVSVIVLLRDRWVRRARRTPGVEVHPAFLRKLTVSKELAEVIGEGPLSRVDVVKKLWAYIRKNNLQDAKERQTINADERLKVVFGGRERVSMFEMTKLVNAHLGEPDASEPQNPEDG